MNSEKEGQGEGRRDKIGAYVGFLNYYKFRFSVIITLNLNWCKWILC